MFVGEFGLINVLLLDILPANNVWESRGFHSVMRVVTL